MQGAVEEGSLGGDRRAVSHIAMFQISGEVPKRALTAGTCQPKTRATEHCCSNSLAMPEAPEI